MDGMGTKLEPGILREKIWDQKIQLKKAAVRVIFTLQKTEHVTKMFRYLKWRYWTL